jgi:hypothetical protein
MDREMCLLVLGRLQLTVKDARILGGFSGRLMSAVGLRGQTSSRLPAESPAHPNQQRPQEQVPAAAQRVEHGTIRSGHRTTWKAS